MARKKDEKDESLEALANADIIGKGKETVSEIAVPDKTIELRAQIKTLESNLSHLEKQLGDEQRKNDELTKQLSNAAKVNERLRQSENGDDDDSIKIAGKRYVVLEVDSASEIIDKVRKSYVEQDAPVAVLKPV